MDYFIIAITVLFGAGLTFFSGFGLGTLLLPVFSLFFSLPIAVAATAIVHLANNLFKFALVYKHIHFLTFFLFGIPAAIFAFAGALTLMYLYDLQPFYTYQIGDSLIHLTYLKLVIGFLMIFFATLELVPRLMKIKLSGQWIPFGGILSGFFGGLSGHQGAFRSAFLSKAGLTKEQFIGTSNAIAVLIDLFRIVVYYETFNFAALEPVSNLIIVGIICAFIGTYFGNKLVKKVTMVSIQKIVGYSLLILGMLFIAGIL